MTTYIWPEGSGGGLDRFAPKYVVGNVLAGDPNTPQLGAFRYIPDPGDGSGIALALTQPDGPGDVWIRPGTYDFGAGSVVVPLTIPAGTRVQGAGNTTILVADVRDTKDPGVFEMQQSSQLRDIQITSNSASGTVGSDSLVTVRAPNCVLSNLLIVAGVAGSGGALTHGITVNTAQRIPVPFTSIENVTISVIGFPSPASSGGLRLLEGNVSARNLTVFGGNIGIELANQADSLSCVFFGSDILCQGWRDYGLRYRETPTSGSGAARISTGILLGGTGGAAPTAVSLEGGFLHVLRSGYLAAQDPNTGALARLAYGVLVQPPQGRSASVQIDDCLIVAPALGLPTLPATAGVAFDTSLGGTINSSSVSDTEINAPEASQGAIYVYGANTSKISLASNTITAGGSSGSFAAILVELASEISIEGNNVSTPVGGTVAAIRIVDAVSVGVSDNNLDVGEPVGISFDADCVRGICADNDVTVTASVPLAGIQMLAPRSVVEGNIVTLDNPPVVGGGGIVLGSAGVASLSTCGSNTVAMPLASTEPAIRIAGDKNTCNGNTAGVNTPATAAVVVSGTDNVIVGNMCGTTPPVTNTGGPTNEVAHNI
jgi:hypothetical protein